MMSPTVDRLTWIGMMLGAAGLLCFAALGVGAAVAVALI